jgi:hypothetical protein
MDPSYVFHNSSLPPPVLVLASEVDVGELFSAVEGQGLLKVGDVLEGGLFKCATHPLTRPPTPARSPSPTQRVRYRPPSPDDHRRAFATFALSALDSVSLTPSPSNATITLHVLPANDPPVAIPGSAIVPAGDALLLLAGTDVDSNITGLLISTPPFRGELYQVTGIGESGAGDWSFGDRVVPNQLLCGMHVGYRYTGPQGDTSADGLLEGDSFRFKAVDDSGDVSGDAEFVIEVVVSLHAEGGIGEVLEDEVGGIVLGGRDSSGWGRELGYRICSLPTHGTLLDSAGEEVGVGFEGGADLEVFYISHDNYFNFPNISGTGFDAFEYVRACG